MATGVLREPLIKFPLLPGGEAETEKGPVDLSPAERARKILLRPGGNSQGEGDRTIASA